MHEYIIILRIIHITCAVLWAGGIFMQALFIIPAIYASGPEGGKVMGKIAATNGYPTVMTLAGTLTVVGGLLLYWQDSNGFSYYYLASGQGMALGTGGILAIIAYIIGISIVRPGVLRMGKLAGEIGAAGGKPTDAQAAEIGKLRTKIFSNTKIMAWLLLVTVLMMATGRYLY